MRTYTFTTLLENFGSQQLLNRFITMKGEERLESNQCGEGFNEDSYEWLIGSSVLKRLKDVAHMYGNRWNREKDTFLGIRMYFLPYHPNDVILRKKTSVKRMPKRLVGDITTGYSYVDSDTAMAIDELKKELNKQYGRASMQSFKKDEKRMNTQPLDPEYAHALRDAMATYAAYKKMHDIKPKGCIKKAIFNDPATIVYWIDGSKTVVMAKNEPYDPEKGLAMAIAKKSLGNEGNYYDVFRKWLPKDEDVKKEVKEEFLTARQYAEKTGRSIDNIQKECRDGLHPGATKINRRWLIPYSGLVGGDKNDN